MQVQDIDRTIAGTYGAPNGLRESPRPTTRLVAYAADARSYDARTSPFHQWRGHLVERLAASDGDVVLDVGCGTGLCFGTLHERVGPEGLIIGVDESPEMLAIAAERVADAGWANVLLIEGEVENVELPMTVDHVLFCAVHDVLQSEPALENVMARLRRGGSVAAGGGKWGPTWAVALNLMVMSAHAPFIRDFAGFDKPWARLAPHLTDLRVEEVALGGGFLAQGRRPG